MRCSTACGPAATAAPSASSVRCPAGFRPSLYVRDDDYRYSFLHGSFVTLTNLTEPDWERLAEQRLSPLYISVHATDQATEPPAGDTEDPPLWRSCVGCGRRLSFHAQLVLVPVERRAPAGPVIG